MKVVFLDVDGVLNAGRRVTKGTQGFNLPDWVLPHAVHHINAIARITGAKFVISSTWRIGHTIPELRQMFAEAGIMGDIIGKTEQGPCNWHHDAGFPECYQDHRGSEIKDWLRNHALVYADQPEQQVTAYAVLDDDGDMASVRDHYVKTAYDRGLTRKERDKVVEILGKLDAQDPVRQG